MKNPIVAHIARTALSLAFLVAFPSAALAYSPNPDLTAAGAIAALKVDPNASHTYAETYNLGPTGLRGWIYMDPNNAGQQGLITAPSRQILVTVASAPASAVLAVDDVILGAMAGSSGTVPLFASDCRKSFGVAIGDAEKTGAGTLRVKRWRAGTTTDENIPMTIMGDYTATAPYTCPKSALILATARIKLVSQLLADPNFLTNSYGGAIKGLALLASVAPGDANYATVQTRLQTYARSLAPANLTLTGCNTWNWGYIGMFLSEYYLRTVADGTPDASVLHGLNEYTVALAKAQSRYGTFGHGGSVLNANGSLHGTIPPYGPVNSAGLPANVAIVMGKKAILASGGTLDSEIDPAIQRGSDFFGYYVNKGSIPYGEHEPWAGGHASNGKDPMCAVLFGLQADRPLETEYFTRMSVAGCTGREYGHTGQGFSYLWGAMGANMGGPTAVAKYLENVRWHLDLERRTDGSFAYDGGEQYGGGKTGDGTYLGACGYYDVSPTASYILSYAVPLQRIHITGRNAIPANILDAAKVANAMAAATFKQDCIAYTVPQLMAALSEYDPVVRDSAAVELAARTLTTMEVNDLIALITNGTLSADANVRQAACQTLGIRQTTGALTALGQRLADTDVWVRAKAARALKTFGAAASPQLTPMLTAVTVNATDPDIIDWMDPIQISNGYLAEALFNGGLAATTIGATKSLLYPAVKVGLKQPDSHARSYLNGFLLNRLTLADVEALIPDLIEVTLTNSQADTMWTAEPRAAGINTLAKYKISEGIAMGLAMQEISEGFGWGSDDVLIPGLNALAAYGDAARWTLPTLNNYLLTWNPASSTYTSLVSTIAAIDSAITAPTLVPGLPVANSQVVTTEVAQAITLTGYDSAGDALTYTIVTQPAHGTLTGTAPNVTYTPAANFYGTDRFTFKTNDGTSDSEPGTVSLIVGVAGSGLKGEYFNNANFTALKLTRTDPTVSFDWAYGSPNALVAPDSFSVRWSGQLLAPETASYRFATLNSDGVRLWVNGVQVLSDYSDHSIRWNDGVAINLTAGRKYSLVMEYYENTGNSAAKLKWTGPSFAGANGVIIANKWLYDGSLITNRTPVALAQSVTVAEDTATAVTLGGGDPFFDALTYAIVTPPIHGTLSGTAPNLTYTPAANYNGADSFTFTVSDGTLTSAASTVSLTLTPVNDATLANAAATYAGFTATTATLNATVTCDEATYSIYAYWGTTNGGSTAAQWQNSALVGTRSNVTASALSQPVTGLTANTRYYFTFRAVSAAGELWAGNVLNFGPNPAGDLLTFGLVNQPAIISGTAIAWPVLSSAVVTSLAPTYTLSPGATCDKASGSSQNFTNPVTYTVTAQDGASKIYTVTVTQQPNSTFTWNATTSGNWSLASKWLNESNAAVAPASGGQTYYTLNFTNTSTYTATNDLSAGFLLNRLNFSGPTTTLAGTNSLAFSQWDSPYGVIAPQVNQNGSSAITISAPITMPSSLTFGGTGTGQIALTGVVGTGSLNDGSVTHNGAYILYLNNANNGYPGGLTVSNSTLKATVGTGKALGGQNGTWQGTRMKLTNATLQLVNGGWCSAGFELLGTNTITQTDATSTFFLGGLTGSGLLNLTGNNAIAFNGNASTYSGDVRINQGASAYVNCGGTDALGSGGTVIMASAGGGKMGIESSNGASLDNYIRLDTNLSLSWSYNTMTFNFKRNISGSGSLTKVYDTNDQGTHLQLRGLNSTYSGGTIFKSGKLEVLGGSSLGTGPVTLGGKATTVPTHIVAFVNLAQITIPNNFVLAGISEPSLTDLAAVTTFSVTQALELSGDMSGTGGLLKTGSQTLTLSGTNTCTGPVKVQAGVLACTRAVSLGQGTLDITTGAKVQLNYEGTRQIAALTFNGGSTEPNGTYGSTSSLATNKDDSRFAGTGMVTIGPVPAANTVATLALTNGANPSAAGTLLTFAATVAGNAPTGTVTFYCGGAVIGSGVLNGSFQASATTNSLAQGWQYVTAVYQGDTNNLLDISEPLEQFIAEPLPNFTPVATAQGVSTAEDTAKAITLAGTDADGNALTYIIITAPAKGSLTGTAPNITYTPAANYTGADSFTFRVNDGYVNSAVVTVSITVTAVSEAPVAYAQSVSVGINSAKAITLVATDADGGALTYTTMSTPANGALSGTAPNVTYTATTNYSGADSFTFRASDGTNNSATVTVSITVTNSVFTWNTAVAGNWSDSGKWHTGSGAPATAGQVDYVLDFTKSGTYTATHDLNAGFLLNQLNFTGVVTLAGTNSMVLSANGAASPQLYQNSASAVAISIPLDLASDLTLGGSGNGSVSLSGVISGAGSLTKTTTGTLTLSGVNSYIGGTVINTGSLNLGNNMNSPLGSGLVTLNSGATLACDRNVLSNSMQFNGGTITSGNSFASSLGGSITLVGTPTFNIAGGFALAGNMSGAGGLIKAGNSTVPISGANNFTGAVTVQAGGLQVASLNRVSGGTATSNLGAPTTVANGTISLGATTTTGTVLYIGTGETTDRIINLAGTTGGATLDQSGASGLLIFTSGVTVTGVGAKTLTLQGATAGSGKFNGAIVNSSSGATAVTKSGTGTWTLAGVNSYTGATRVTAGTLACSIATSLGSGTLDITSGAKLNLDYVGTRQVAALTFNLGSAQPNGTYGSSSSSATFKNDTYFAGTGTVTVGAIVGGTTTALALTGGSSPSNLGAPLTFTATVAGGTPTGSVTFYAGANFIGTSALNGSFQAAVTTSSLAAGFYYITAQYAGDENNASSTSTVMSIQVGPPVPPGNLVATPSNNSVGLTWSAPLSATGYNVKRSLTNGGSYTTLASPAGTSYTDTTAVNGTTYYYVVSSTSSVGEGVNSAQASATPSALPSTTTLGSSLGASGVYGSAVTFTATVVVTGGPATGTVTFKDGVTVLGTGALSTGTATFASSTLLSGAHSITATYGGDATFASSISSVFSYAVTAKPLTVTGVTASNKVYDGTTTATLTGGTLVGVVNGDSVTLIAGSGTFANSNAGTWAVTASGYSLGGANAGNYTLSAQPTVPNASITARPVVLTGSRIYDGTLAASGLSVVNNIDGANLGVTGSTNLVGKDVGSQALSFGYVTPVRVRSATGNTGASAATTISVTMAAAPVSGNTMVAVISTRGTTAGRVTSITQTGATWSRVTQATNASGTTTELWSAPNVSSAAAAITINQASLLSAAVVMEYSGVLAVGPTDQINNSTGSSSSPVTGTTATTTQASELWVGGIGFINSTPTLGSLLNSFASVANAQSTNTTTSSNAKVYALERIANATGAAASGGTLSVSAQWSGAIATFKAASASTLALTGSAAGNYTLIGVSGAMTITPKPLTVAGLTASAKVYDGTSAATLSGTAALLTSEAAGAGTTSDGKPYTGDVLALGGTAAATFADPNVATAKAVTVTGLTLTGAGSGNYTLTQPAGLTADITASPLTVTASNQSKTYGQTVAFGSGSTLFTSSGLQNGEAIGSVTLVCTGGGAAAAVATYPITPGAATGGTFAAGNYTIQYVDGTFTVNLALGYESWASDGAQGLTAGVNDAPSDDPDHDGFSNLMEFALGGAPMVSSQAIQPTFSKPIADWVFEYNRSDAAQATTTQVVEYGSDLSGWTPVAIPETSFGIVEITPGSPSDHVKVTLPVGGNQTFTRLKVSQP